MGERPALSTDTAGQATKLAFFQVVDCDQGHAIALALDL
jgi:hypothetical protein